MGEQGRPATEVPLAPLGAVGAQALPTAVLDLDQGLLAARPEGDLHVGGLGTVTTQVPEVTEPVWRLPCGDLAPVVLGAVGPALMDASTEARLEGDPLGPAGHRVVGGPPLP